MFYMLTLTSQLRVIGNGRRKAKLIPQHMLEKRTHMFCHLTRLIWINDVSDRDE